MEIPNDPTDILAAPTVSASSPLVQATDSGSVGSAGPPELLTTILKELSLLSLNYGLRARCREVLKMGPDPLSVAILEAREDGIGEAYMVALRLCAPHDADAAETLRFITEDDEADASRQEHQKSAGAAH